MITIGFKISLLLNYDLPYVSSLLFGTNFTFAGSHPFSATFALATYYIATRFDP